MAKVQLLAKRTQRGIFAVNCSHLVSLSADDAGRCKSNGKATLADSSSSGLCLFTANTQSIYHSAPAHLQTCFASFPPSLLSHNTQKQGENQNPHKKSRWEYIIWSEKQFVLAIYCLCAKVISLSSSISAGSSY